MLALLACHNEQAVKEITQQEDGRELEIGQQRLHKAFKIVSDPKTTFDQKYHAIINYNLACSY